MRTRRKSEAAKRPIARRSLLGGALSMGALALACETHRDEAFDPAQPDATSPDAPGPPSLWFGGDVHYGDGRLDLGALASFLEGSAGVVNLEGPVARRPSAVERRGGNVGRAEEREVSLANHPDGVADLARQGIVAAGVMNNHALDAGRDGLWRTVSALRRSGIDPIQARDVTLVGSAHHAVALTAHDLSSTLPPGLEADIAAARRAAGRVVATLHVTGPPSYLPSSRLRAAARRAANAGAMIVIAHGSHALAPIERIGSTVVCWGLGNLRFACECTDERDGLLVRLDWAPRPTLRVLPIRAGLRGEQPTPSPHAELLFELLEGLRSMPLERDGPTGLVRLPE